MNDTPGQTTSSSTSEGQVLPAKWRLEVDPHERESKLFDMICDSSLFDVRLARLRAGDYIVQHEVLIERKTYADFAVSVIDGRLFRQAAVFARLTYRPLILVEGPRPSAMPDVHPHALKGAVAALAIGWCLPVLFSAGPEGSLLLLKLIAGQCDTFGSPILPRQGYRPKRLLTRKLFVLQGLPGVGPAIAKRLLDAFGSVEQVVRADPETLQQIRGLSAKRAAAIRAVLE
jgi:Fanconi anemia group M protein